MTGSNGKSEASSSKLQGQDNLYRYDEAAVDKQDEAKPWKSDHKYFKNCKVSALCAMKMLKHSLAGVKKGQSGPNGKPLEVMGLLLGKPDGDSVVVMDCYPLPVEGFETSVVADNDDITNYMIQLSESLEETRKERFIGWYHSHPFDVGTYSQCFLSATDIQTQLAWQRNLDPKWVAIVVDPLRSVAKQTPDLECFRCYPPEFAPPQNEQPDGTINNDEHQRIVRWGKGYNRYYELGVEYFMSNLSTSMLDILSKNSLWISVLSSSSIMQPEYRHRFADRVLNLTGKLDSSESQLGGVPSSRAQSRSKGMGGLSSVSSGAVSSAANDTLNLAGQASAELAIEQCQGHALQIAKDSLFNVA